MKFVVKDDSIKFIIRLVNGFMKGNIFFRKSEVGGVWHQAGMSIGLF